MTDTGPERTRAVVDASVTLKWALDDEEHVDRAVALRDAAVRGTHELIAPSLWAYEVTNGLVAATQRGRMDAVLGAAAAEALFRVGVRLADPDPAHVFETSIRLGLSAYDAAYVALAEVLMCPLWTGDRPLLVACGVTNDVRWIGDFS